ncbi:MAG: hypothetical protein WC729_07320 [Sphingomonas sp.]|uniref:hypothetical protein n=1 Tax=Sphingomonas sp. TaxID=28214 RepID=UPI0035618B89
MLTALPAFESRMRKGGQKVDLFLSAGQYEQSPAPGMENDPAWLEIAAFSLKARMVDNARELAGRLAPLRGAGLSIDFAVVPGETHATGDFPAIREALRRAFGKAQP